MNRALAALLIIYAAVTIAGLAAGVSRLALARLLRFEMTASMMIVSSLTTWFMASRAVSSIVFGVVADLRPSYKKLFMGLPMLGIGGLVYLTSQSSNIVEIMLYNALWGFLSGVVWPITQTVTSLLGRTRSGTVMSIYFAIAFLGVTGGQYLYGVTPLTNRESLILSSLFFTASGLLLLVAAKTIPPTLLAWKPGPKRTAEKRSVGVGRVGVDSMTIWLLLVAFAAGYASGVMREFLYIYLGEVYGLDRYTLSLVLSASGVAAFAASLAIGPFADRAGVRKALLYAVLAGAAGGASLALAPTVVLAALGVVLVTSSSRSTLPLTRNAVFLGTGYAATIVGVSNTINNIGQVVSPIIAGAVYDAYRGATVAGMLRGEALPFATLAVLYTVVALLSKKTKR